MTSINFKVLSLTQLSFKPPTSGLERAIFGFPDLPKREAGALHIRSPCLVEPCVIYARLINYTSTIYGTKLSHRDIYQNKCNRIAYNDESQNTTTGNVEFPDSMPRWNG